MKVDFNTDADHIDIPLNKYGLSGYSFVVLCVLLLGLGFVVSPSVFVSTSTVTNSRTFNSPQGIFVMGLLFISTCGPLTAIFFYRIFIMKAGLTINMDGIMNNSSMASVGFINWKTITKINKEEGDYPISIVVYVNGPEEFIQSQSNIFKRKAAADNYKKYGSPAVINTYWLKCDYDELCSFLTDTLKTYKEDAK
jgi:hypothetical protein